MIGFILSIIADTLLVLYTNSNIAEVLILNTLMTLTINYKNNNMFNF